MLIYKRGKRKVIANYKTADIYKFYEDKYGEKALPKEDVMDIWKQFFPELVKLMVFNNVEFKMPSRLGTLRIKKRKVKLKLDKEGNVDTRNLSINWKKTKKLWQEMYPNKTAKEIKEIPDKPLVRELNEHTDGFRYIWYWDKITSNVPNQSAYYLDLTRDNDRILSGAAKTNYLEFYE